MPECLFSYFLDEFPMTDHVTRTFHIPIYSAENFLSKFSRGLKTTCRGVSEPTPMGWRHPARVHQSHIQPTPSSFSCNLRLNLGCSQGNSNNLFAFLCSLAATTPRSKILIELPETVGTASITLFRVQNKPGR